MIIECSACQTRFRLADDKLKPEGTKVRCSKCKEIFTVFPPETAPEEPKTEIAPDEFDFGETGEESSPRERTDTSLAPPSPPASFTDTSSTSEDFADETVADDAAPSFSGPAEFTFEEEPAVGAGEATEEEGSAFGFSFEEEEESPSSEMYEGHEDPGHGNDVAETGVPGEFFTFEEEPESTVDSGTGQDFDPFGSDESEAADFSFAEEAPASDSSSGDIDFEQSTDADAGSLDFSFEEEPAAASAPSFDSEFGFEEETPPPFSRDEISPAGEDDDFSWSAPKEESGADFSFSAGDERKPSPADAPASSVSVRSGGDSPEAPMLSDEEDADAPAPPQRRTLEVPLPPAPARRNPLSVLVTILLLILVALCAAAGFFLWQGGTASINQMIDKIVGEGTTATAGQIQVSDLSSYFIENREVGQIFVINGKAVNQGKETRSSILVKGILFDKAGKPLAQQTVFCGNVLDQGALARMPFSQIEEAMNNQFGDSLSNLNVESGKSIPFTIVFKEVPATVSEYTVEASEPRSGSDK